VDDNDSGGIVIASKGDDGTPFHVILIATSSSSRTAGATLVECLRVAIVKIRRGAFHSSARQSTSSTFTKATTFVKKSTRGEDGIDQDFTRSKQCPVARYYHERRRLRDSRSIYSCLSPNLLTFDTATFRPQRDYSSSDSWS
jgi:hypothetical protein